MSYLTYDGISFRPVEEKDLDQISNLRNEESTWVHLTDPRPVKKEAQKEWLARLGRSQGRFYWMAEEGGQWVGLVRVDEYDPIHRSIRIGADVVPELRNRGFGTRILKGVIGWAFDQLGVHRVWLLVLQSNPAIRLYTRLGFVDEGAQRQAVWRNGAWVDYKMMSILEQERRK